MSEATESFTPADLCRIAGDAKSLYASDLVSKRPLASASDYLQRAIAQLVSVCNRMADLLGDESLRIGSGSDKPKYGLGLGGMAEMGVSCKTNGW